MGNDNTRILKYKAFTIETLIQEKKEEFNALVFLYEQKIITLKQAQKFEDKIINKYQRKRRKLMKKIGILNNNKTKRGK